MTSKLIFGILLCMMLIAPAFAYEKTNTVPWNTKEISFDGTMNVTYDASKTGERIALAQVIVPMNSTTDFTIFYGTSSTVTGTITSGWVPPTLYPPSAGYTTSTISMGGTTKTYQFFDIQPVLEMEIIGYGKDTNVTPAQTGFLVYSVDYGLFDNDLAVFYPVSNIGVNTIYRIDVKSTKPIDVNYRTGNPSDIATGASKSVTDMFSEWLEMAKSFLSFMYGVISTAITWVVFLWENIGLIIALYIAMTGFMAFQKGKKNIMRSIGIFLAYQKKLFETILALPHFIVDVIEKVRNILRLI